MKINIQKKFYLWVITLTFLLICMGCATKKPIETVPQPPAVPETQKPNGTQPQKPVGGKLLPPGIAGPQQEIICFEHIVKYSGETISIIAGWYTKDINNWKIIAEVNPDLNPKRIITGNKIRIPEYLMKTHDPMPKEYVDSFYPQKPVKPVTSEPKPQEEEPPLFGPK